MYNELINFHPIGITHYDFLFISKYLNFWTISYDFFDN